MNAAARDVSNMVILLDPKVFKVRKISGILPVESLKDLARNAKVKESAQVEVILHLENDRWHVSGQVHSTVEVLCSRCLDPFTLELVAPVKRDFIVGAEPVTSLGELEVVEDLEYLADGHLAVVHLAEEELIVAMPMIPLCRQDCAGLCQGCGAELNREPCRCKGSYNDSPFGVLKGRLSAKS